MTRSPASQMENSTEKMQQFTVVKRNGAIVPFRRERIFRALEAAFRDTKKIIKEEPLSAEVGEIVNAITDLILDALYELASKGASLSVEGIQDQVEIVLMKAGHHDVARDYIIYRDQHKVLREDSPQNLKVLREDGSTVRFNPMKIASSIEDAFRHAGGPLTEKMVGSVNFLTQRVVARAVLLAKSDHLLTAALIEDEIEQQLMREGFFAVAKIYILNRSLQGKQSTAPLVDRIGEEDKKQREFSVIDEKQKQHTITEQQIRTRLKHACRGLEDLVFVEELLESVITHFYQGMKEYEVHLAFMMAARAKIEIEPAYSTVAARLLLDTLYRETMGVSAADPSLESTHRSYFKKCLQKEISLHRAHPDLLTYDLDKLACAMQLQRDDQFTYLGLQTLYDRYFIHQEQRRLETPQIFWMRIAMGLALCEKENKNERVIEFYDVLSKFYLTSSTPTLFNSGTMHPQLSSCYLSTVMDDLGHIFKVIADDAQLSKWAGGLGNDWSNVRATGATIKGTNGKSQGVIPFLKVANDTAVAVNQCFSPETLIYTSNGIKPIAEVELSDLVLGVSGLYRPVKDKFAYNQKDPMVSLKFKHSLAPVSVTAGHPFYAIRGVPLEQSVERTLQWLSKGKVRSEWIDAGQLKEGDYVAQVIPKEVVAVSGFEEDDARLYGILLGDGHMCKDGDEWGVSGNPKKDSHLEFVREYLRRRHIHFWECGRDASYLQIRWASGRGAVRDATTGRIVGREAATLPFEYEDIYDEKGNKTISARLSHLPIPHTLAFVQGLLETDGNVSRGKEITFTNTSLSLVEGLRYQLLRLGIPAAGKFRRRQNKHVAKRSDGSVTQFNSETQCYDLRIPAAAPLAERMGCAALTKYNWLTLNGHLFTRVKEVRSTSTSPFVFDLKVEDDASYMITAGLAHNGGKRKGAMCAYLETWHLDIEDFIELRKNTGDERRRTHDMNTANWIPDLFMKRVESNGQWTLFSPSDVPDLHHLYGAAFEKRYVEYEKMVDEGKIKLYKHIEALQLWRKMLSMLFETAHPWITFKDPSNVRSPQDHAGVVHSSNLCTEILLNTSSDETAVCNLASVNLDQHMGKNGIDEKKLAATIRTAMRMLDNVIDINFYPIVEARKANSTHRPVGLGVMGFQDVLYRLNVSYASHEAVACADQIQELVSYYAILASSELAKERGTYASYKGSKWDRGLLPFDTIDLLEKERGGDLDVDRSVRCDWKIVRESIKKYGMRNSNTMAIAPTATISNITGVTQSIEPMYKHLFVKSNLSGEFTVPNTHLVTKLKEIGLWDEQMLDDLKYFDGSIAEIDRIPEEIKKVFLTAFEIDPEWLIECASRRQKWIDMGQSLNLYLAEPNGKKLDQMYRFAWKKGLKTTYYLRSLGATQIEKSTTDINKRGIQPRWMKNKSASSNIQLDREVAAEPEKKTKPKACSLDEGCESCQ
ncbi:MAG TPA: ribonucleoside-diphosphate reductase subunit alpha [Rhabdochlamydiaceae bacterium]|jgi:ribonucleoside-diphosphate reductase alpha chain